jgi:hypothetical protein
MAKITGKTGLYNPGHYFGKGKSMSGRGILEFAKATGQVDVVPGFKIFTGEYLTKGQIIALDSSHWAEVTGDGISRSFFVFIAASAITGGPPSVFVCENEEKAVCFIEMLLEAEMKILGGVNI